MVTTEVTKRSAPLDGIRGVAVLAVVFHHARVTWGSGALTSISIFFPLSGYLITRNLLREFDRTGVIHLGRFWWRRARRLMPASLLAVAFTAIVAHAYDFPVRASEIFAAITGWKNWHYLTDFSLGDMFVIWWSLAIEEQYYLVYPLLVFALLALGRRRGHSDRRTLTTTLTLLMVVSFAAMLLLSHAGYAVQAYYGTHGRLWEILTGCLLAIVGALPRWSRVPSWLGLLGVLTAMSPLGVHVDVWWMPAARTLLAIVSTIVLMDALSRDTTSKAAALLGARPFEYLGTISYEIYLTHYPVIVIVKHLDLTAWQTVSLDVLGTLLVSSALHAVVTPLRAKSR